MFRAPVPLSKGFASPSLVRMRLGLWVLSVTRAPELCSSLGKMVWGKWFGHVLFKFLLAKLLPQKAIS